MRSDNFNWVRRRGATPTTGTGPTGDHTSGKGDFCVRRNDSVSGMMY